MHSPIGWKVVLMGLGLSLSIGVFLPMSAWADTLDLSLQMPTTSISAGGTGSFDVVLTDAAGSGVTVGGFDFEVVVGTPASGVNLTNASTSTLGTYIFSGNSLFGPTLTDPGSTSTDLIASDVASHPGSGTSLNAGESVDLGSVSFNVSASAPTETVSIDFGAFTDLSDNSFPANPIAINNMTDGTLNIIGATTAVPEPSSVALLLCGLLALWFVGQRRFCKGE